VLRPAETLSQERSVKTPKRSRSTRLCDTCLQCEYLDACGGGHLAQRWSSERKFDNPSVYCASWKRIFDHIWDRIAPTLTVEFVDAAGHRRAVLPPPQQARATVADAP
jgi:sulfatase maturation enzyme AslB (radical SAM superfamily)